MQRIIEKVISSAESETSVNLDLIESLKESTNSIKTLSYIEDKKA